MIESRRPLHASPVPPVAFWPHPAIQEGLPLRILLDRSLPPGPRRTLALAWGCSLVLCILFALLTIYWELTGQALRFGGAQVYVTIYPPLVLCTLWVLWFGVRWGAVPAYLATLAVAVVSGMPWYWSLLFAFSNVLGYLVLGTAYRAIQMPCALRSAPAILFFVAIAFIANVFSATGSFVWSHTNALNQHDAFAVWQGWWLGGFLQTVFIVGPVLALCTPAVLRWRQTHFPMPDCGLLETWRLLSAGALGVLGVLGFLWLSFVLSNRSVQIRSENAAEAWRQLAVVTHDATVAVYWILTVLFLAMVFLGYRFFLHWTGQLEDAAERLAQERDMAMRRQQEAEEARAELERVNQELAVRMVEVESLQYQLQEQAIRDPLTHLYNRRYLQDTLPVELQRAQRQGYRCCVVMIDLDHFKAVNDVHGHAVGDAVLVTLAGVLRMGLRSVDFSARYGGEEFCLVLSDLTGAQAQGCVHHLQRLYASQRVMSPGGELSGLTFSAGVAEYPAHGLDEASLLLAADQALYAAKEAGRNRVFIAANAVPDY
ncbi:GGDEF domain-containing protein [Chitinilyticum litopenaei]|uniref:GGDEF domain-containing protein n=1 Tax=Chitinilyticum litopenaei TaxID=1121276 RepID=UPI0004220DDB|nr:GGDEF domain-containing protein [Chitinilyticum litopenaei]